MIIETKLHVPQTKGGFITRPHLYQRLDEGLNSKLTLITSPAGYGKSTLLSDWSTRINIQVAWVSFDVNDNNKLHFWTYIIESLKSNISTFDKQFTLHSMDRDPSGYTLIAMLINQLNRLTDKIILVWDDFHTVNNDAILNGVNYLLERLPTHVHVYIASRTQPQLSLSRLRVEGSLLELGIDDLRFGMEETKTFFNHCTNLSLSRDTWMTIHTRTEGWIAGMRVAVLSLHDNVEQGVQTRNTLDAMTGKHRNFADYFLEEVFMKQSIEMQQFLLKTSILNRMNATLSEIITGIPNGTYMIRQLERMNLFLVSLDGERQWYRYHHLFQDFLQMQLQTNHPELIKPLNMKAGHWLEEKGFVEEALDHYLTGENYQKAVHLLEKLIPSFPHYERITLHKWLNQIPKYLLIHNPILYLMNAASLFLSGHVGEATNKYWWAVNKLEKNPNFLSQKEKQRLHAGLNFLVAFRSFLEQDFESFIVYSEKYLEIEPSGDLLISFGSERDGYHPAWDIYVSDGRLINAEKTLLDLLEMWSKTKNKPFYAHLCIDYGQLLYEWNELEEAKNYIQQALIIGKKYDNVSLIVKASLMLAQIHEVENCLEMVDIRMEQLLEYVDQQNHSTLMKQIALFQAQIGFKRGKIEFVRKWLQKNNLSSSDEITSVMLDDYDMLVRILQVQGKTEEALELTNRLLYIADNEGKTQKKVRFQIYKSLLFYKQNNVVDSFQLLEAALSAAKTEKYVRTFLDEGVELEKLLTQYVSSVKNHHYKSEKKKSFHYAKRLLELMAIEYGIHKFDDSNIKKRDHENLLTPKEKMVLLYIEQGFSNKAIADELGISLSTVKTHINHIYRKLGVHNRLLAVQKAQKLRIL